MAATQTSIANRALIKLGEVTITSIDDDEKSAVTLKALWDNIRDDELRANRWSFSVTRAQIAEDATAPAFGYTHRYPYPSGCLRFLMIGDVLHGGAIGDYYNTPDSEEWSLEGNYILTNYGSPLNVVYLQRITDVSKWDDNFAEVMACRLAMEACEPLTQSDTKYARVEAQYERAMVKARRSGAIEKPPKQPADGSWVLARTR